MDEYFGWLCATSVQIRVMVMVHGDYKGLVLHHKVASVLGSLQLLYLVKMRIVRHSEVKMNNDAVKENTFCRLSTNAGKPLSVLSPFFNYKHLLLISWDLA
ncbi:hypothetical protein L6164_034751 [Bauhinia variegata]|uniref:Uncharacterized protein n=1 Tax=Bauhinia variegata TaxID=167791 RepID=A0ACB9KVJ9_BAUVA|nr:hypothetical protein L6164_034751 [Bauhinia variegata]